MSRGGASPEPFGFPPVVLPRCKEVVEKHEGGSAILTEGSGSSVRLGKRDDDGDRRREATEFDEIGTGSSGT